MKKLIVLAVVIAAAGAAIPAYAGGCGGGKCGGGAAAAAFDCSNPCPLAKEANTLRSSGNESIGVSSAMCANLAASVQKNLARI
jgi:hypothetical protein